MSVDPALTVGSFLVAIMVGLTGMGGGALLTPMLMLVFGVPPLAAVSSDLVVSAITKPIGALVHLRRGTVNLRLAGWLVAGSVPSAFLGGLINWWLGDSRVVQTVTQRTTGVVLIIAAAGIIARLILTSRPGHGRPATQASAPATDDLAVRKLPTLLIGIVVGLAVGITSTGSGTLIIAALTALYPMLPPNRLVGTDLAQAVPMVLAASLAHAIAGDVQMSVTAPLLIGGIPGVVAGSLLASRAPGGLLRPVLSAVILASGLSLIGLGPVLLIVVLPALLAAAGGLLILIRRQPPGGVLAVPRRRVAHPARADRRSAAELE